MLKIRNKEIEYTLFDVNAARTYIDNLKKLTEKEKALDQETMELDERLKNRGYLINSFLTAILGDTFFDGLESKGTLEDLNNIYYEVMNALNAQCLEQKKRAEEAGKIAAEVGKTAVDFLEGFIPKQEW